MKDLTLYVAAVAGFMLPLFNIPLAIKIYRQKSAKSFSLIWAIGLQVCTFLMLPQVLVSPDLSYKIFGITNFLLFAVVFVLVMRYRKA